MLLDDFGLSDQSTLDQLLAAIPGLGGTTFNDLMGATTLGDESWSDLVSSFFGADTTLNQFLSDILASLTPA